jgi:hypothetical protein
MGEKAVDLDDQAERRTAGNQLLRPREKRPSAEAVDWTERTEEERRRQEENESSSHQLLRRSNGGGEKKSWNAG